MQFGDGVTVVSAVPANSQPGDIAVNTGFDGVTDTAIVESATIAGAADASTPTVHTYTVTVVAEVDADLTEDAADCAVGAGEAGSGLLNTATLEVNGEQSSADACGEVPRTDMAKDLTAVTTNGDGTYTLTYELTVTRTGAPGTYDLHDELRYGQAVTPGPVTVSPEPVTLPVNAAFDGVSDAVLATDVPIGAGETH